ncbi:MAG: NADH-quinone oxidoreductase subunit J [Acetobacteraceae bacterium]
MNAAGIAEIVAFAVSAFIAVAGALGMATTMSMFRSGIFLMASFMGVAALFILLAADLLGLLQIMMYIGGMLVMILFMVLVMPDPGGAMMADMPDMMTPVGKIFSLGLKQDDPGDEGKMGDDMGDMNMSDMAMVTPVHRWAVGVALLTSGILIALLLLRPAWKIASVAPDPRSAERIGSLLMDKYMVGFEGAGFLILIGIVGAVFMARTGRHGEKADRDSRAAIEGAPPEIEADGLIPTIAQPGRGDAA